LTLEQRLTAFAAAVGADVKALLGQGSVDPYTRKKLASDFSNSTVTFNTITDGTRTFTFTPPANTDFEIEAWLLIQTATATVLPRVGVSIGAGQAYGSVAIEQVGATTAAEVATFGTFLTAAVNVQVPAGGVPAAATPYEAVVRVKGRSGAAPAAITIQMASETAGTACLVKAGSEMKTRIL
jgi:hypothetical protein